MQRRPDPPTPRRFLSPSDGLRRHSCRTTRAHRRTRRRPPSDARRLAVPSDRSGGKPRWRCGAALSTTSLRESSLQPWGPTPTRRPIPAGSSCAPTSWSSLASRSVSVRTRSTVPCARSITRLSAGSASSIPTSRPAQYADLPSRFAPLPSSRPSDHHSRRSRPSSPARLRSTARYPATRPPDLGPPLWPSASPVPRSSLPPSPRGPPCPDHRGRGLSAPLRRPSRQQ